MEESLRIQVVLAEYNTLRAEVLQRISHRQALVTGAGALGAFAFFSADSLTTYQRVVLAVAALVLFALWWDLGRLMLKCADRVGEIEVMLNDMDGSRLMGWESNRRGSGLMRRVHTPREHHRYLEASVEPSGAND